MHNKDVEPLLPVELGAGKVTIRTGYQGRSLGICHGRHGAGFRERHCTRRAVAAHPTRWFAQAQKEALRIWENIDAVLRAAGTDRTNLVRTDQYYATVEAVPAYQQVRRDFLAGRVLQ